LPRRKTRKPNRVSDGEESSRPRFTLGAAHAPSPDVRGCHRGIRELDASSASPSWLRVGSNAGSRPRAAPRSRTQRMRSRFHIRLHIRLQKAPSASEGFGVVVERTLCCRRPRIPSLALGASWRSGDCPFSQSPERKRGVWRGGGADVALPADPDPLARARGFLAEWRLPVFTKPRARARGSRPDARSGGGLACVAGVA